MPNEDNNEKRVVFVDKHFEKIKNEIDGKWVGRAFISLPANSEAKDKFNLLYSSADTKFIDNTPGGSLVLNPTPQYTRYCDIRRKGLLEGNKDVSTSYIGTNVGVGSYWSKAHDDNKQFVTMEFGTPDFNNFFSYFTRAISYPDSVVVNQGRTPYLYYMANTIGTVARYIAVPGPSIALLLLDISNKLINGMTSTKYYTMKPNMYDYWSAVNSIVNALAIERGIIKPSLKPDDNKKKIGSVVEVDKTALEKLNKMIPGIVKEDGYIDVFAIANRTAGRITNRIREQIKLIEKDVMSKTDMESLLNAKVPKGKEYSLKEFGENLKDNPRYKQQDYKVEKVPAPESGVEGKTKEDFDKVDDDGRKLRIDSDDRKDPGVDKGFFETVWDYYKTTSASGGSYLRLQVEYLGQSSWSFSNSIKDIPTKDKFNNIAGASRDVKFSLSDGNLFGDFIDGIKNAGIDVLAGVANGVSAGLSNVIIGLLGGGYLDMPKMWADSDVTLPSYNFKVNLRPVYGNPISQLLGIDLPLATLLAAALPRKTGEASYGSPFLCSLYMQGYCDIKMGMITSLSVDLGTNDQGRDSSGRPLDASITFQVTDFDQVFAAPIARGITGTFDVLLNDEDPLNRFLASLTARDFYTSKYIAPKALMRIAALERDYDQIQSPTALGMFLSDGILGTIGELTMKNIILGNK